MALIIRHFFADLFSYTDGEVVIMLAFQASGTGSIPVRCTVEVSSFYLFEQGVVASESRYCR